jgi:hypothetical protein
LVAAPGLQVEQFEAGVGGVEQIRIRCGRRGSFSARDRAGRAPMRLSSRSQGFHLLTTHLPKPRLASGNISGRMMSPRQPWSKSNQFGSDAGWRP